MVLGSRMDPNTPHSCSCWAECPSSEFKPDDAAGTYSHWPKNFLGVLFFLEKMSSFFLEFSHDPSHFSSNLSLGSAWVTQTLLNLLSGRTTRCWFERLGSWWKSLNGPRTTVPLPEPWDALPSTRTTSRQPVWQAPLTPTPEQERKEVLIILPVTGASLGWWWWRGGTHVLQAG